MSHDKYQLKYDIQRISNKAFLRAQIHGRAGQQN